jgi:hypothetical protein
MFETVFGMMITVKNDSIKKLTKEIVLNFIQNFPLSEQLLEKIIMRLINNLDFAEPDGRLTVLGVFEKLFDKLPVEVFKKQIEIIVMGFTARLVNEEVPLVHATCTSIFKKFIDKINNEEELRPVLIKMFDNCLIWLRDENEGTKRAGIHLLSALFWATGDYSKVEAIVEDMVVSLNEIYQDIENFWESFKTDEDLKAILRDNQWRDVMLDEDNADPDNPMGAIKATKLVVMDYLKFADSVLCHEKTKLQMKNTLFAVVLKMSRHPDEEVQRLILGIVVKFMETSHSKAIVKEHLKSLLIFLFAILKSKHLKEEVCQETNQALKCILIWFSAEIPKLMSMILTAITNITFKYMRFSDKFMYITNKCISASRALSSVATPPLSTEDMEKFVALYVRLLDHGSIRGDKESVEMLEMVILNYPRNLWQ